MSDCQRCGGTKTLKVASVVCNDGETIVCPDCYDYASDDNESRPCPFCGTPGAGPVSSDCTRPCHLWVMTPDCEECRRRHGERMRELGRKHRREYDRKVINALTESSDLPSRPFHEIDWLANALLGGDPSLPVLHGRSLELIFTDGDGRKHGITIAIDGNPAFGKCVSEAIACYQRGDHLRVPDFKIAATTPML